ncbi:hypothetical protein [Micromonospora sp. NPDC003816]|uniref:hypothetical protein n=1 Tax=Micromonospora sp. NPDC003816 TaxID=3364224 RepID=UPI003682412A
MNGAKRQRPIETTEHPVDHRRSCPRRTEGNRMFTERRARRAGLMAATVMSLVLGVAIQPVGAATADVGTTPTAQLGKGTVVARTVFTTSTGEEYVAEQSVSVVAASSAASTTQGCPAPPPDSTTSAQTVGLFCVPKVQCRTLDSTYRIYVIPTYVDLVRWRMRYTWCWEGSMVTSVTPTPTTPDILSGTIRVSGGISRTQGSLPARGGVDVYTEGLQFDVIAFGLPIKAFNPKIRFYLTSVGNAYNLSVLA